MKNEQLEQLQELIEKWRKIECFAIFPESVDYETGKESAYQSCADDLEELVQTFNQDEEG